MKKRYLSILLSLSLCLGTLPAPVFAEDGAPAAYSSETDVAAQAVDSSKIYTDSGVTATGDGSEASPFKTFEEALNAVDAGGTIIIKGQGYLNDSANGGNGDYPLVISKEITIQGEAADGKSTASFNIRAGGFVLGADVTIKNLELGFSGMIRPAIFVNGHTLTANAVTIDTSAGKGTAHIFAGGYSAASAAAGSGAAINLTNCSFGNIYAGGMGQAYDKDVSVTLNGTCRIDAVYGYGATDIDTPNENYGTSGKLTVTLNNTPGGFKASNTTIDGTGAGSTEVSVENSTIGKKLSLKKITNFSTNSPITIDSLDTLGLMNIALNSDAKLNLLNSTENSFGALTGAGTLQIGKLESLAFSSVEGSHILETLTSAGVTGKAEYSHTYITQNGGTGRFTLAEDCKELLMLFEQDGNAWKTSSGVPVSDKVSKFSFTKTEGSMSGSDFREKGLQIPVSWTHQMLGNEVASLSHIPLDYEVSYDNGTPVTAKSVPDTSGMYEASLTINGAAIAFTAADKNPYEDDTSENIDRIELHSSSALSAGVYKITVKAPTNSDPISAVFTLTIADGTNPPTPTQKADLTTDMFELTATTMTFNASDRLQDMKGKVAVRSEHKDKLNGITMNTIVKAAGTNTVVTEAKNAGSYDIYISFPGNSSFNALPETKLGTITIAQADAPPGLQNAKASRKVGSMETQTISVANVGMPEDAGKITYSVSNPDSANLTVSCDGSSNVTITKAEGAAGKTYTIPVTLTSENYKPTSITLTLTLTEKDIPTIAAEDITVDYNGSPIPADKIKGTATFGGQAVAGEWSWDGAAPTNAAESGTFSVKFTPEDSNTYASAATNINVTIRPLSLSGAPTYAEIKAGSKTLADAKLTKNAAWGSGTLEWQDANGAPLPDTTPVTQGTSYKWVFTPDDTNYKPLSNTVILWKASSGGSSSGGSSSGGSSSGSSSSGGSSSAVKVPASSDHNTVNISASVSKGTASVSLTRNQINQVISDGKTDVAIDVSGLKNVESAKLPANIISAANDAQDISLTVTLPAGSVSLDDQALASLPNAKDVTVSVEQLSPSDLTAAQKAAIGDQAEAALVVDVNILIGSAKQSNFGSGKLTISVPYTPKAGEDPANLTIWFIRDDGTIENKGGRYDEKQKCFIFETEHLSKYILVNLKETKAEPPRQEVEAYTPVNFLDVSENAYYADAVAWASAKGITGGIKANYFGPDEACTRAQVVAFLWRAAGKPAVASDVYFGDVKPNAYYSEAIRWAAEAGIVSGYSNGLFGTNDPITREQMVAILYRYAQSIGMDTTQGGMAVREFQDYADISGYAVRAMQWAVNTDILKGAGGYIMPDASCTRAQIVSFLYRIHQGK